MPKKRKSIELSVAAAKLSENDAGDNDEKSKEIKSNAVVKYSAALVPAPFTMLQSNTDLNLPPPNWLSNSVAMYGVPHTILNRTGFTSFTMANKFPDCVGNVDVVSDAENIKKLLKMAYSSSPISLMVHRVQNTLLIDDFDVKKVLLASEGRWSFYQKFFEHVFKSVELKPENVIEYKNKSRQALQNKSLNSKFLYHSLVARPEAVPPAEPPTADPKTPIPLPFLESDPPLPEAKLEEELPDPTASHTFSRNVVWTFEDIQMLLGTDIPIFGGGTHPCISLKLRDMTKPINVLTGLDYWLDNLMCNVPEVVMCYHLNGIVQKYELIKTEDLPHLPNSKFSPNVVRGIAQNILSFLKTNATKAGHTYWLFKGKDDDVVKLYDLTCLCNDILEEGQTPFTVPVAMLLYRVARNMKHQVGGCLSTVCTLLRNCVSLLPEAKYPEIAISAHYMLADVFLPSDIDPRKPNLVDESDSSEEEDCDSPPDDDFSMRSMSLAEIREEPPNDPQYTRNPTPAPLSSDVMSRCTDSLTHVLKGLHLILDMKTLEPEIANPSEPIPMPGTPESENKGRAVAKAEASPKPGNNDDWSWADHLKALLLEKACLIYLTLLEHAYSKDEFGVSLRYAGIALRILKILERMEKRICQWEGVLHGKAGDALLMVVTHHSKDMTAQDRMFHQMSDLDNAFLKLLLLDGEPTDLPAPLPPSLEGLEQILLASEACYSRAVALESEESQRLDFRRRLGNVENELGVYYMNQACLASTEEESKRISSLLTASQTHLDAGIAAFKHASDTANLALLFCNSGRLLRLRAHYELPTSGASKVADQERLLYNKAISLYQRAIDVLKERSADPKVWDAVYWELSSAFYGLATLLQDHPVRGKSREEAERELTDVLHKALKYVDLETPGAKLPVYQFRAAKIHRRLASLHHSQYRLYNDPNKRKHDSQLARLHYEKAARLFQTLEHTGEALELQMERIGLDEMLAEASTSDSGKIKHLSHALNLMVEMQPMLEAVSEGEKEKTECERESDKKDKTDEDGDGEGEERQMLLETLKLMLARLQAILLALLKIFNKKRDKNSSLKETYKNLCGIALRCSQNAADVKSLSSGLASVLSQVSHASAIRKMRFGKDSEFDMPLRHCEKYCVLDPEGIRARISSGIKTQGVKF